MSDEKRKIGDVEIERADNGTVLFVIRTKKGIRREPVSRHVGLSLWEAAAPPREDGEGDAARMMVKNAIGFTRSEAWGQISDKARVVVLLDALRALDAQPPTSDTEGGADEPYVRPDVTEAFAQMRASIAAEARRDCAKEIRVTASVVDRQLRSRGNVTDSEREYVVNVIREIADALAASPEEARNG